MGKQISKKNLKIVFVGVKEKLSDMGCEHAPLGLLSMATYLMTYGNVRKEDIRIVDTFFEDPVESLNDFSPDIIAVSVITPFYLLAREYAVKLHKKFPRAKIILGGAHISSIYSVLDEPFLLGAIGEGEVTMLELVKLFREHSTPTSEQLRKVGGIVFRDGDRLRLTPGRKLVERLDDIPQVDWTLLPKDRVFVDQLIYLKKGMKVCKSAYFYTSRGCPYNCTFCAYNNIWGREAVRFFTPKYFGEVVENLYTNYGVTAFCILDDTFAITKKRVRDMIEELGRRGLLGKVYFFKIFMRANLVDDEMAALLDRLGVVMMFLGIESGSQRMMDILKNKSLKLSQVTNCIEIAGKHGINIIGSFMFFSPDETKEDIDETLKFIKWFISQKNALDANVCVTTPFPGTDMWKLPETKPMVSDVEKYLKRVRVDGNQAVSDIFYYNGMSVDYCNDIWKQAEELSATLTKRWRRRELMYVYSTKFHFIKKIGWKNALLKAANPSKWKKLFLSLTEPISGNLTSRKDNCV